ncbi:MAG: TetR/AcrR family transcriptional regulator [Pseudomonadota bacterium]
MNQIRPNTRDAIIEAAFQTFSGDPGASLADVAERAGVGRATLHRHFKGRDDLMVALAHAAISELDEAVDAATADAESYSEALRISLAAIIPLADRQWFLAHEPVDHNPEIKAAYQRQLGELAEAIDAAKAEGSFSRDIPTGWIVQAFDHLTYAAWESVRAGESTASQAASLAWRTLTTGLGVTSDDR